MGLRKFVLAALLAAGVAASDDTGESTDTCAIIRSSTDIEVAGPSSAAYADRWYWNAQCAALEPTCVLLPSSTEEVAQIVKALRTTGEEFAVKSGGHNPNLYFASVGGGPLISTQRLDEVTLDEEAGTVRVGPGNRWERVAEVLDGTGYTVPGGRVGHVGVGGLLLGNGLSFLSAQHGWAANSVLEYSIVLPNGTAATVSATSHPDLFLALRGGGNNLGVVTSFLMRAYPQAPQIWGGTMTFLHSDKTADGLLTALRAFAEESKDDKAAVILVAVRAPTLALDIWNLYTFYDGPEPPAGIFDDFVAVGPVADTSVTQSYLELMLETRGSIINDTVYTMGSETAPLPEAEHASEVLGAIHDNWRDVGDDVLGRVVGLITTTAYQPFTRAMARAAREKGGDLLDVDDDVDRVIVEHNFNHVMPSQHDRVDQATVDSYEGVKKLVEGFQGEGKLPGDVYLPLFLNDVYFRQDYFGRVRPERRELVRRVVGDVDPEGWWGSTTGGVRL